jgi:hypothetical protein
MIANQKKLTAKQRKVVQRAAAAMQELLTVAHESVRHEFGFVEDLVHGMLAHGTDDGMLLDLPPMTLYQADALLQPAVMVRDSYGHVWQGPAPLVAVTDDEFRYTTRSGTNVMSWRQCRLATVEEAGTVLTSEHLRLHRVATSTRASRTA